MTVLILIFAALITAVGWHYTFDDTAGARLSAFEKTGNNRRRIQMRRAAGVALLAMGPLFYLGFHFITPEQHPRWFVTIWAIVLLLLILVVVLALLDVRLTHRMRRELPERERP